jgi:hypothetical protein
MNNSLLAQAQQLAKKTYMPNLLVKASTPKKPKTNRKGVLKVSGNT